MEGMGPDTYNTYISLYLKTRAHESSQNCKNMSLNGQSMKRSIIEFAGWLPAIVIPAATLLQLNQVYNASSVDGVSWPTWLMFGLANIGFYIYTEKYKSVQSILGFLGTAAIDFVIVAIVVVRS